jgi:prepilin-type N-terminal cleavage/methylation domain-containing protein/prepilin-type processing-associated H-X9-DG protein
MNRKQAFTLIELLVVIAIIALLLAVIIPSLKKAKEKAQETICRSNLKNIGMAFILYLEDNDYKTYNSSTSNGFEWTDSSGHYLDPDSWDAYWGVAYKHYVDEPDIFGCPSLKRVPELIYNVDPELIQQAAFSLNSHIIDRNVREIKYHPRFIVTHDHVEPKVENGSQDMFHNDGPGTLNLKHYRLGGGRSDHYREIFRHSIRLTDPFETGGRANILWLDGHVEKLEETTGDNVPERWYTAE